MNLFKWFTAGAGSAEKVLDAGIRGIDALVLTEEERLNLHKQLGEQWIKLQETLGPETTIRAVTRRILSVLIMVSYVGLIVAAAAVYKWDAEYTQTLIDISNGNFGWMALSVTVFYFGPYMLGNFMGIGKKKGS